MNSRRSTRDGFTLIEVMVALVVVSLGMMAVHTQLNRYVVTANFMEETSLARWIGSNKITELSIQAQWPDIGDSSQEVEFAGRSWTVRTVIMETEAENLRRADVYVSLLDQPDVVIDEVSGIIEPPIPQGFQPVQWVATGGIGNVGNGAGGPGRGAPGGPAAPGGGGAANPGGPGPGRGRGPGG